MRYQCANHIQMCRYACIPLLVFLALVTLVLRIIPTTTNPPTIHHQKIIFPNIHGRVVNIQQNIEKNTSSKGSKRLSVQSIGYSIPGCSCVRLGFSVDSIKKAHNLVLNQPDKSLLETFHQKYNFKGESTCSDYATQRGSGQNVVVYSYYPPFGQKVDLESQHFKKYLAQLHGRAATIRDKYPGWKMRIYHNITQDDEHGNKYLCRIYCSHQHVDFCHITHLPGIGNLQERDVVGRLWRFAVMGDPTVDKFLVRDSDSWILDREVTVVNEWLSSDKSFHLIRDHPNHTYIMLAGLWGGVNKDVELMKIRDDMFAQPLNLTKGFDQYLLATKVWPYIKNDVMQHDSYNCRQEGHEGSLPFPIRRLEGMYCGWGPFKVMERKIVLDTECPIECRPKSHQSWEYC